MPVFHGLAAEWGEMPREKVTVMPAPIRRRDKSDTRYAAPGLCHFPKPKQEVFLRARPAWAVRFFCDAHGWLWLCAFYFWAKRDGVRNGAGADAAAFCAGVHVCVQVCGPFIYEYIRERKIT